MSDFKPKVHFSLICSIATAELIGAEPVGPCTVPGLVEACKEYSSAMSVAVIAVRTAAGPSYLWPLRGVAGVRR